MPECRGVPGTMIFALLPFEVCTASASSAAFLALLESQFKYPSHCWIRWEYSLFSLPRHLRLQLGPLGEFSVSLPTITAFVEVLLFDRVKDGAQFRYIDLPSVPLQSLVLDALTKPIRVDGCYLGHVLFRCQNQFVIYNVCRCICQEHLSATLGKGEINKAYIQVHIVRL